LRALLATARATCASLPATSRVHLCTRLPAVAALLRGVSRQLFSIPGLPPPLVMLSPRPEPGEADPAEAQDERAVALGYGQAARLCPMGPGRIDELIQSGQAFLSSLRILRADECGAAPAPRLYGGLRFATQADPDTAERGPTGDDPWHGLPDAHFVLPRWVLILHGGLGYLQLNITASDLQPDAAATVERELAAIEAACQTAPTAPPIEMSRARAVSLQGSDAVHWQDLVLRALTEIAHGRLDKIVLARGQRVAPSEDCELPTVLSRLSAEYPTCLRFVLPLFDATMVGATPELLVARQGRAVRCDALAGSLPRRDERGEPEARRVALMQQAQVLLSDEKEAREHAHVVAALRQRLLPLVADLTTTAPQTRVLRNLIHLWTPLQADLKQPTHILHLLAALHPTPAVCGLPQAAAAQFIATQEVLPRGYYAAPVGWFDGDGDGEFYVAIRSALLRGGQAWLFAGAGIVAGSQPEKEFRETAVKLQPMLAALGLTTTPASAGVGLESGA
jgi:isochorismate synthase